MSNFKAGQKVVCVSSNEAVVKGKIYNVIEVFVCKCGEVKLKVNAPSVSHLYKGAYCISCGYRHSPADPDYYKASRFRPISDIHSEWTEELVTELETEINQEQLIEA